MKRFLVLISFLSLIGPSHVFAQKTCTSNPGTITSDINFGSITWQATGGATVQECDDMADGVSTFTGRVIVDLANNTTITITNNVNVNGDFPISGGPGSILSVNGGYTLYVTGDLGNPTNNGVQYNVETSTDKIIVDGTLYGKNDNAFTGDGQISGGTLDVKNGSTCGTPCPVSGGFDDCTSDDGFCTTNSVLPIILLYFEANPDPSKQSVKLEWATTMEEDFDKFIIQRSDNGRDFNDIGEVAGQGRNLYDIKTLYAFEDEAPLMGFNYYRLKALDLDGIFEHFQIIALNVKAPKRVVVYPNPSEGNRITFRTNFTSDEQSDRVVVIDALGTEVINLPVGSFNNTIELDKPLQSGVYILKYTSADFESISRIVIKN